MVGNKRDTQLSVVAGLTMASTGQPKKEDM
jgi:hypothetical protein